VKQEDMAGQFHVPITLVCQKRSTLMGIDFRDIIFHIVIISFFYIKNIKYLIFMFFY